MALFPSRAIDFSYFKASTRKGLRILRWKYHWKLNHLSNLHVDSHHLYFNVCWRSFQFAFSTFLHTYDLHRTLIHNLSLVFCFHIHPVVLEIALLAFSLSFLRSVAAYASWIFVRTLFCHSPGHLGLLWILIRLNLSYIILCLY